MRRIRNLRPLAVLVALVVLVGTAQAAFELKVGPGGSLFDGTGSSSYTYNPSPFLTVTAQQTGNRISVDATQVISGFPTPPSSLQIQLSANNLSGSFNRVHWILDGAAFNASVQANSWLNTNNVLFGTTTPIANVGPITGAFGLNQTVPVAPYNGTFSLTEYLTFNMGATSLTSPVSFASAHFETSAVPEPVSIAVWSTLGAAGAGAMALRRRNKRTAWSDENRTAIYRIVDRAHNG